MSWPGLILRGYHGSSRCGALLDADHRDRLELQALHAVHRPGPDSFGGALGRQGHGAYADGLQRFPGLVGQVASSGSHPDRVRLDARAHPGTNPLGQRHEPLVAGCGREHLRPAAVHGSRPTMVSAKVAAARTMAGRLRQLTVIRYGAASG